MTRSGLGVGGGAALYVGAVLGPGMLLLPALAVRVAGPASILAWFGLLLLSALLAVLFGKLGVRYPEVAGPAGYVERAIGPRAAALPGWWFFAGVLIGAPTVSLVGGLYVATLLGGGMGTAIVSAAVMFALVLAGNSAGLRLSARLQLVLTGLLAALLVLAVATALPAGRTSNFTPFAPHGWLAVGSAVSLLALSIVGWEAVGHLTSAFDDPGRQLPRAIGLAFAVIAVLYVALAVATVAVLGGDTGSQVPLADLMSAGLGHAGRMLTAVLAVLLTTGTTNTYVAAAKALASTLSRRGSMPAWFAGAPWRPLAVIGAGGGAILAGLAAAPGLVPVLVRLVSTCFVAVYLAGSVAAARLFAGRDRALARLAIALLLVVLAFSGWYVLAPVALAPLAALRPARRSTDRAASRAAGLPGDRQRQGGPLDHKAEIE